MSAGDAEIAIAAAARGAEVVRTRYGTDLQRYDKAPGDFATDADIAAERAIRAELAARCPADAILGDGSDVPARPDASSRLVDLNLDPPFLNQATFRAALLPLDEEFAARFGPRVLSTSLALAWVAAGRRAGYVTDGDLRDSVHFAAGIAVCAAAGVIVTGLAGQPVHTGVHGLVAAADADTHATLLACIGGQRHA